MSGSNIVVSWVRPTVPASAGSAITSYTISIAQSDGTTFTVATCSGIDVTCDSSCTCTVPFSTLQAAPYNLAVGASVYAKVLATNANGSSPYSPSGNGAVITAATAPSAPAAPTTSVVSNTDVTISWTAPSNGGSAITGYTVQIRESDGATFTTESVNCGVATTSCTVPISVLQAAPYNLPWGASIYASVTAKNAVGSSAASASGNGAVIVTNPDPPSSLANDVTATTASNIALTWVAPSVNGGSAVIDYRVSWDQGTGVYVVLASNIAATSYTTTATLTANTAYAFKVESRNSFGYSATFSNIVTVGGASVPTAPLNLANNNLVTASGIAGLTWSVPTSDGGSPVIDYQISSMPAGEAYSVLATGVTLTSFTAEGLTPDATYTFKVSARNAVGYGAESATISIRAAAKPSVPAEPTTAIAGTNVQIFWAAPSNGGSAITGYTVAIKKSDGMFTAASCSVETISCTTSCTCQVSIAILQAAPYSLAAGDSVVAKVLATNVVGSSAYSAAGNGAVIPAVISVPAAPFTIPMQTLTATINQQASISLPPLNAAYSYAIQSIHTFQTSIEGIVLQVLSKNQTDVGTQYLDVVAVSTNNTVSFKVKVVFQALPVDPVLVVTVSNTTKSDNQTANTLPSDLLEKLKGVVCNEDGQCVDPTNIRYSCQVDEDRGQFVCGLDLDKRSSSKKEKIHTPPTLAVSQVTKRGTFTITFSEPMDLSMFINKTWCPEVWSNCTNANTTARKLRVSHGGVAGSGGNIWVGQTKQYTMNSDLNSTNATTAADFYRFKYLLDDQQLRLAIQTTFNELDDAKLQFEWFAVDITDTTIKIQILFQHPTFVSYDRTNPNWLKIKLLPGFLIVKAKASQMVVANPLRTEKRRVPPQIVHGTVSDNVEAAASNMKSVAQAMIIGNFFISVVLQGIMDQMYLLVNSLQMMMVYSLLGVAMPANVSLVMTQINVLASFDYLPSQQIMVFCFDFSKTVMPLVAFQEFGVLSLRLTLYLASFMVAIALIALQSLLFVVSWPFTKKFILVMRYHRLMRKNYYWRGLLRLLYESYFDLCIGIMFSWQAPRFDTASDIFDFCLTFFVTLVVLAAPLGSYLLLRKYANELYRDPFLANYGSLTEGLKDTGELGSAATIKTIVWFFVRRFLTAVVVVFLGQQSPVFQITAIMYLALSDLLMNFHLNANDGTLKDLVSKINDIVVFLLSYFPFLYCGLIQDTEVMYQVGWVQVGLVAVMFAANFVFICVILVMKMKEQCRRVKVEKSNLRTVRKYGFEPKIVVESFWQKTSRICQIEWALFDRTPPRINEQIRVYVEMLRFQIEWGFQVRGIQPEVFKAHQEEIVSEQKNEIEYYQEQIVIPEVKAIENGPRDDESAQTAVQTVVKERIAIATEEQSEWTETENTPRSDIGQPTYIDPLQDYEEKRQIYRQSSAPVSPEATARNPVDSNQVFPIQFATQEYIYKHEGKRKPIIEVDPLQVKNFNKTNLMARIVEGLYEKQDPIFENIKANQGAIEIAILLPDRIYQMSLEDQENEVRYLLQVFAESEKADQVNGQTAAEQKFHQAKVEQVSKEGEFLCKEIEKKLALYENQVQTANYAKEIVDSLPYHQTVRERQELSRAERQAEEIKEDLNQNTAKVAQLIEQKAYHMAKLDRLSKTSNQ